MPVISTLNVHPDSAHYGHRIVYAEYGWRYYDVVTVAEDKGELEVFIESDAFEGEIAETRLMCETCQWAWVAAEDVHPDADIWESVVVEDGAL